MIARVGTAAHWTMVRFGDRRFRPRGDATVAAMGHGPLSPGYASGRDFAIEAEGMRFLFSADDFASRVGAAAVRLGVVGRDALTPALVEDLVALAAHGRIRAPQSPLARHLDRHRATYMAGPGDLVHWLRRLVFRGAWVDQQVRDGVLVPEFDDAVGFRYRVAATGERAADEPATPDWGAIAYTAEAGA